MKKRILSILMAIALSMSGVWYGGLETRAEEMGEDIDYSYLLTDSALVGYAEAQTWGVYLLSGTSVIDKIDAKHIAAGGTTTAAKACYVSVVPIVERKTSTGWARVTSWDQTNENAYSAMVSKSLTVGTGYYYRVRSTHYAGTDVSSSMTSSLWM